jgi:hypothetical protein
MPRWRNLGGTASRPSVRGIITRDRPREHIVRASAAREGARFWRSIMAGPTNRGARNSLITCCDDLAGRPDAGQGQRSATSAPPVVWAACRHGSHVVRRIGRGN